MKKISILILICFLLAICASAQEFNKSVNKDSLLKVILKELPEEKRQELLDNYYSGNDQSKEFILFMFSMPRSSKSELTKNIDTNYPKIEFLKNQYAKLVPDNYVVSIEFNPENKLISTKETIDLRITQSKGKETIVTQEWNLAYDSPKLKKMLTQLGWTASTVINIKKWLSDANSISIENGKTTTIGFARSGLGKYSYQLFDKNLNARETKKYNDGCLYIFYKDNIVLQYGGGAVGPQCFPD